MHAAAALGIQLIVRHFLGIAVLVDYVDEVLVRVLDERGIFVIPDILCNAGGVFVSYLEYTQETQREQMTLEHVEKRLAQRMRQKFNEVYTYARDNNITMRQAAMNIAVNKVVEGIHARGMLP